MGKSFLSPYTPPVRGGVLGARHEGPRGTPPFQERVWGHATRNLVTRYGFREGSWGHIARGLVARPGFRGSSGFLLGPLTRLGWNPLREPRGLPRVTAVHWFQTDGVQDGLSPDAPSRRFASHGCTMARPAPECTLPWRRDQTVSVQQVRVLPPRTGNITFRRQ